jgi:hypothetical protein
VRRAFRRRAAALRRNALAPAAPSDESSAIDNAPTPEDHTMSTTTIASRLQSLAAAALMTLATLTVIDHLAAARDADGVLAARVQAAQRA